jgi:hypothetical protein
MVQLLNPIGILDNAKTMYNEGRDVSVWRNSEFRNSEIDMAIDAFNV